MESDILRISRGQVLELEEFRIGKSRKSELMKVWHAKLEKLARRSQRRDPLRIVPRDRTDFAEQRFEILPLEDC